ncbi:hypothetical protein Cyrtocomes_00204 [Candidatus Cyrtobacter comes]|uniref:Uncharacterized protein n=1 Tax=Candidatus Cyrtobacter comes TaxID=675776 RepID=A0ABU5L6V1_9RICK|nr:hypothetical protein [Candidatus Cyrtobacter comes]MDZ5761846.1 hypothetical protein [Candidatus Cyrtobacter comes]
MTFEVKNLLAMEIKTTKWANVFAQRALSFIVWRRIIKNSANV